MRRLPVAERCHQMLRGVIQTSLTVHEIQRCYLFFLISLRDGAHGRNAAARHTHTHARTTQSSSLSMSALLIGFARTRQNEGRGRQGPLLLKRYIHSISGRLFHKLYFYVYFTNKWHQIIFWISRTERDFKTYQCFDTLSYLKSILNHKSHLNKRMIFLDF